MTESGTARCLLCFGLGYSARVLAERLIGEGWEVRGTARDPAAAAYRRMRHVQLRPRAQTAACRVRGRDANPGLDPAGFDGDPVLDAHAGDISALPGLAWLGYLSTTGVYGDRGGFWVDEESELHPSGERGRRRVKAEAGWLDLWRRDLVPVHVFRLAAIYGPGRSPFAALRDGTAKRIDKRGQVFSRIHVEDLASVLAASIAKPCPGAVYNVCDDEAAPPEAVVAYAAGLLGVESRRSCRSNKPRCRRWRAAFMTTTSACRTPGSNANSGSRCATRPFARG